MSRLLYFLGRIYVTLLFVALELTSVILYVRSTPYTEARMASIASRVHMLTGQFRAHLNSKDEAKALRMQNSEYAFRIAELENRIASMTTFAETEIQTRDNYSYMAAHVISNTVAHPQNMITIDRGYADGVTEDSAIVTPDGSAVGIIVRCSEHFSVAKSLLNTSLHISGRLAKDQSIGSVTWDGASIEKAEFNDVTQYADISVGDEVVAAGFSHFFPDGTKIGTVESFEHIEDRTVYSCHIRLYTDFSRLRDVVVVSNLFRQEQTELEQN